MTTTSFRPSDYLIAIVAAVLGHLLLFLLLVVLILIQALSPKPVVQPEALSPEVLVEISPELFQRPQPETPPLEERNRYVRTLASQETAEEAQETNLIGEHNTRAASEEAPDLTAPERPSQDGVDPRHPDQIQTFNSSFQDGEEPALPQEAVVEQTPPGVDIPHDSEPVRTVSESRVPQLSPSQEELRETETRVPVLEPFQQEEERREEESLPKETEAEVESTRQPKGEKSPAESLKKTRPPQDAGFNGEVRKTRLRGSIGRNGPSSQEVKNTPLGRYQALLSRSVEREWQKSCIQYRDHITPGFLTIRFLVGEGGRVSGFRFIEVVEAGAIQKGFTLNSIKKAKIPKMSPALRKELDGEPLELIYNFYF